MREKFYRFMVGRSGPDQFSRFLSYVALVLVVANLFARTNVLWALALAVLIFSYYRMFSRRVEQRRRENAWYLRQTYKLKTAFTNWRDRLRQRKDYVFFRCPSCRAMLRVPRGKGRIRVTCRKCGTAFERRT